MTTPTTPTLTTMTPVMTTMMTPVMKTMAVEGVELPPDVGPFCHLGDVVLIVRAMVTSVRELLVLRGINRTFKEAIDEYVFDVWFGVSNSTPCLIKPNSPALVKPNSPALVKLTGAVCNCQTCELNVATKLANLYAIEQILSAFRWKMPNGLLVAYEPQIFTAFATNQNRKVDELFMEYCDINYVFKQCSQCLVGYTWNTVFREAIMQDNPTRVEFLIANGADVDQRIFGNSSLCLAADTTKKPDIIRLLIDAGADVNCKNHKGEPMILDVRIDKLAIFLDYALPNKLHPNKNLDVNAADGQGKTLLMSVIGYANVGLVEKLVKKGANLQPVDRTNRSALNYALEKKVWSTFVKLVELGASLFNFVANEGFLVSILKVRSKDGDTLKAVKALVDNGADLEEIDKLDYDIYKFSNGSMKVFSEALIIIEGAMEKIKKPFINKQPTNSSCKTPLLRAASLGHEYIVSLLLTVNADMQAKDINGLGVFSHSGNPGILELLIKEAQKRNLTIVHDRNEDGNIALQHALRVSVFSPDKGTQMIIVLLEEGVNKKISNDFLNKEYGTVIKGFIPDDIKRLVTGF